jgi:hypothetical protein
MQSTSSPSASPHAPDARTQAMLRGPIAATLLRFAAPTVLVVTIQALVSIMETYFVGILGTDALAGVALVFPVRTPAGHRVRRPRGDGRHLLCRIRRDQCLWISRAPVADLVVNMTQDVSI